MYWLVYEEDRHLSPPSSTSSPGFEFQDKLGSSLKIQNEGSRGDEEGQSNFNNHGRSGHHHFPPSSHHLHHHPSNPEAVVTMSGGPLSYRYNFDSIYLHFGRTDVFGSEHVVAGVSFPAEVSFQSFLLLRLHPSYPFLHAELLALSNLELLSCTAKFFIFSVPSLILNLIYCLDSFHLFSHSFPCSRNIPLETCLL